MFRFFQFAICNYTIVLNSEENNEQNKNIEESKIKENSEYNFKNRIVINLEENNEKNKNIEEPKIKTDNKNNFKNKIIIKPEEISKNKERIKQQNISDQKREYQPKSYKIIFILKDVDPKDPIQDLSTILRNSDVNFEIEKIELFFDSKNKSSKSN